ncbi:MAG: polysaccharide deacetylase family protein [Oscillospiraceae bacterium]|nr:polysaccharide deacetylase family protein [Oscillospiraceae bacterium]
MRKLTFGLILALTLALSAALTGCEPNVPDNNNDNNAEITILPNDNNRRDGERENDEFGDGFGDENNEGIGEGIEDTNVAEPFDDDVEGRRDGEAEDGLDEHNGTSAAEGDTPAADFSTAVMTLLANNSNDSGNSGGNDISRLSNTKIGWGLGKRVDEYNRPLDAVEANANYKSFGATFIGESGPNSPTIYLTFDEGYESGHTVAILDSLKWSKSRATFFVTYDYCERVPDLVRRMIDEGHTIGNHSYSHPSFPDCTEEQVREEIQIVHDYVKETFDYEMNLVRFPMGEFSERSLAIARDMGYTPVFWSFAYADWNVNNQPDKAASLEKLKAATHPGGIFLLHAVSQTNAEILGDLLNFWHSEGYSLGIIGETQTAL